MIKSSPISPHLQRYKLPLNAWFSIFHRLSGIALFIGFFLITILLVIASHGEGAWQMVQPIISHSMSQCIVFLFTFILYFHLCNGIRHLFWDIGKGLDLASASRSAKIALTVAILLNLLTWLFVWL
ncbi:MAG: succinate dehydrogenase, cytochrome b556 subunit [Thiotrichaceae bacterium]|nr:succinate dehydrogenase, cytochrome b556 subunit [Thiotrichaceae bacterium]